jgi:hypothetical protein
MEILLELRSEIFETIFAPRSGLLCSHSLLSVCLTLCIYRYLSLPAYLYLSLSVCLSLSLCISPHLSLSLSTFRADTK